MRLHYSILFLALAAIAFFTIPVKSSDLGERIYIDNSEIYFKSGVTRNEALAVLEYMTKREKFNSKTSFQLTKRGENFELRTILREGFNTEESWSSQMQMVAMQISSNALNEKPLEIHICDGNFNTKQILPFLGNIGKRLEFEKAEVYFGNEIERQEAGELATLLDSTGFLTGEKKLILLKKINDVCQVSFFIREGVSLDENLKKYFNFYSKLISSRVFNQQPTEIVILNEKMKAISVFCGQGSFGERLEIGKDEIFFTNGIEKAEAIKIGEFFTKTKFFTGMGSSIQLSNNGEFKEVKVICKGRLSADTKELFRKYMKEMSRSVLERKKVLLVFCDETFEPIHEIEISG